jgi:hypothetical protein
MKMGVFRAKIRQSGERLLDQDGVYNPSPAKKIFGSENIYRIFAMNFRFGGFLLI